MNDIRVDTSRLTLTLGDNEVPCAIGRSGACPANAKKEGDGCTPMGEWPVLAALFRPGLASPPTVMQIPWRWIGANDGWSDDPVDPAYNRPVSLPHRFGHEKLNRDDMLYDIIVVLGHNMYPPRPGLGSAIFFHLWDEEKALAERTTEGCVAISRADMTKLLPQIGSDTVMRIH